MAVPYMPLYVADYMADTGHLTTQEHGAYLLLIMAYWQRGEALPNDDRKLSRIAGLGPREWKRIRPTIEEFFKSVADTWLHSRLENEIAALRDKSLKKRKGGLARAKQMHSTCAAPAQLIQISEQDTLAKASDAGASQDKVFWDNAKAYLGASKSGLIGKWIRDYGKAEAAKAITAAQVERAVDPIPYIERVLRGAAKAEPVIGI